MPGEPPPLRQMMEALVAEPSISAVEPEHDQPNRAVVDRLAQWAEDAGFAVEVQEIAGKPGKANLIATLGQGGDGLVLAGHTDTVPTTPALWSSDPFRLDERDGRLYGLGICDMKAFLALALDASRGLRPRDLRQPLILLATADEECDMSGARALLDERVRLGRQAVIGEPTGMRPARMHKGVMMEAVRIVGRSGHSSNPALGINALDGMTVVLNELIRWRSELAERYRNDAFNVPYPTLNLGSIHGGDNPNRICASAELHIDIRPLPGMTLDELRHELDARLTAALGEGRGELSVFPLFSGQEPMETAADAAIVRAAERQTGEEAGAVAFGTEGPFFARAGMDVVIWGPGDIDQAHQPDEYLAMDRIEPTLDGLRGMIRNFCVDEAAGA